MESARSPIIRCEPVVAKDLQGGKLPNTCAFDPPAPPVVPPGPAVLYPREASPVRLSSDGVASTTKHQGTRWTHGFPSAWLPARCNQHGNVDDRPNAAVPR